MSEELSLLSLSDLPADFLQKNYSEVSPKGSTATLYATGSKLMKYDGLRIGFCT